MFSEFYFLFFFFFIDPPTTEIYTLSLHDALPIFDLRDGDGDGVLPLLRDHLALRDVLAQVLLDLAADDLAEPDRKSTRLNSSHVKISYAVFCLKKKKKKKKEMRKIDDKKINNIVI